MQRSLAFMALGAIVAAGALCAVAASAYGAEPRDGAVPTTHAAALVVPSGYKPSTFAPSPARATVAGLVSVPPHRAVAVTNVTSISSGAQTPKAGANPTPNPTTNPAPDAKSDSTKPAKPAKPISSPAANPTPPAKPISTPAAQPTPAKGSNNGNDVNNKGTGANKDKGSKKDD